MSVTETNGTITVKLNDGTLFSLPKAEAMQLAEQIIQHRFKKPPVKKSVK
ncbi:MAG: hypothetical protein KGI50_06880 [Patescibacteria group bacterium]|nr:hypothetical protein [Patescibacteria group bacterium]MDE2438823.1 hypothetical protein [Patescibacteria group bacterium]